MIYFLVNQNGGCIRQVNRWNLMVCFVIMFGVWWFYIRCGFVYHCL